MAAKSGRPGRTLIWFFAGLAVTYGLVALAGEWKPALGLDLRGGTRIQLIAQDTSDGQPPTPESLEEARKIIDQRVNGSGVVEAEVLVEGSNVIAVEIPGESRADLEETVKRTAQLRFRVVACSDFGGGCGPGTGAAPGVPGVPGVPGAPGDPGGGVTLPSQPGSGVLAPEDPAEEPAVEAPGGGSANRAPVSYADETPSPSPSPTADPTADPTAEPTAEPTADPTGEPGQPGQEVPAESTEPIPAPEGGPDVGDPLTWKDNPNPEAVDAFNAFTCPPDGSAPNVEDDPAKPLVTCGEGGEKFLLSASMIEGTSLDDAAAQIPQQGVSYVVSLDFDSESTTTFAEISRALLDTGERFAIVLDGQVISAPTMDGLITDGRAQISGDFEQAEAESLATSLKFGALPIAFADEDTSVETIGPSLAGNQLSAGLVAGGFGLVLVMIYCMFYYRGLGIVIIASLAVAAATTYAMVLLLAQTAGFTLTLPGIAGLIVAIGITADSFIVYFERIRDEMRDGKSMRVAVEAGWVRARMTCVAADAVSLLAAVVLFIFAVGVVKGFAFALGLTTLIDLVVFFFFTKPLVSTLARMKFFNSGTRFSGLSAETLGVDAIAHEPRRAVPAGGRA